MVDRGAWLIALIMFAGFLGGYGYTAPPLKLAYRGLGELDIFFFLGPAPALGVFSVLTGTLNWTVVVCSVPVAGLIAALLWINEYTDYEDDREAGKLNLVVRLGPKKARWGFAFLAALVFGSIVYAVAAGIVTAWFLLPLVMLPIARALGVARDHLVERHGGDQEIAGRVPAGPPRRRIALRGGPASRDGRMTGDSADLTASLAEAQALIDEAGDLGDLYPDPSAAPQLSLGGKLVRPRFLLMAAEAMDVLGGDAALLAAAVEVVHNASLFHDDVVDEADRRRGRRTLHSTDGNRIAIMAGDVCFARAMALVTRQRRLPVFAAVARTVTELASGQLAEAAGRGADYASRERYFYVADRKTGALLALCLELPVFLADRSAAEARRMADAGYLLGRAFQVADDLLDFADDAEHTGKDTFNDLAESKVTYPYLLLMESGGDAGKLIRENLGNPDPPRRRIVEAIEKSGVRETVARDLESWLAEAATAIDSVVGADRAAALHAFSRTLAFRSR